MLLAAASAVAASAGQSVRTTTTAAPSCSFHNAADLFGTTPLIAASRHGQEAVVRRLLREPGIDVDAVDKDGMSAVRVFSLG